MAELILRGVLLLSVTLATLPNLPGVALWQRGLALGVLFLGICVSAIPRRVPWFLVPFVLVELVALGRLLIWPVDGVSVPAVLALAATVLLIAVFGYTAGERVVWMLFAPAVFVMINLTLFFVGFRIDASTAVEPYTGDGQLLSALGIGVPRSSMPLTPGLNGGGAIAGVAIVVGLVLAFKSRGARRWWALATLPGALATIAITDSRGVVLLTITALVVVALPSRFGSKLPLALPFAPALILYALGLLSSAFGYLSRNPGDFATATGRSDVWGAVARSLSPPEMIDLVGYGAYGQVTSGVGYEYAFLFGGVQPEYRTAHNVGLQTLLDTGYLGLAVFLTLLVSLLATGGRLHRHFRSAESLGPVAGIVALVLYGTDEALPSIYFPYMLAAFFMFSGAIVRHAHLLRVPALNVHVISGDDERQETLEQRALIAQ